MEKRLVDANELKEDLVDALDAIKETREAKDKMIIDAVIFAVCNAVDRAETVEPVKHGKWEVGCAGKIRICSKCKESFDDTCNFIERDWHYCPNCGAIMGGE